MLIPDFLAYNYSDTNIENLINKNIDLPIVDEKEIKLLKIQSIWYL